MRNWGVGGRNGIAVQPSLTPRPQGTSVAWQLNARKVDVALQACPRLKDAFEKHFIRPQPHLRPLEVSGET